MIVYFIISLTSYISKPYFYFFYINKLFKIYKNLFKSSDRINSNLLLLLLYYFKKFDTSNIIFLIPYSKNYEFDATKIGLILEFNNCIFFLYFSNSFTRLLFFIVLAFNYSFNNSLIYLISPNSVFIS